MNETFPKPAAAWECPRCHRINAPHTERCDCVPAQEYAPYAPFWPSFPIWVIPTYPGYPYPHVRSGDVTITCASSTSVQPDQSGKVAGE